MVSTENDESICETVSVIVAVCTFYRNDALINLLSKIQLYSETRWSAISVGVTIIDDSPECIAKSVADTFSAIFPRGLTYIHSGAKNISIARNMAIEDAKLRGTWIAMTDDDCEPCEDWLPELIKVQRATGADVTTGLMLRRIPDHSPAWLKTQPFLVLGEFDAPDGELLMTAFTNNCLISSQLMIERSDLRFLPELGKVGGEDMVFFKTLSRLKFRISFAKYAFVYENEPDSRLTMRYQLRRYFWHGNSSVLTSLRGGTSRPRLAVHAIATLLRAICHPAKRLVRKETPQFRFTIALICEGLGKISGVMGFAVSHQ